jgi:hypothetical protein
MTAALGVNYTKSADPTAANILTPGSVGGKVHVLTDTYEASTLAENSTIKMGAPLPGGAIVLGIILLWDALGTSTTLAVGDQASAARYITAAASTSAGRSVLLDIDGALHSVTTGTDDIITITLGGAAGTGTIKIVVFYTTD